MTTPNPKPRVVVLGGGMGALSTVYHLTSAADWRERFESITVYQLGWRLGGKCASARGENARIEEHGLHIWMGWYQNAFRMIRDVYAELERPADAPLATWDAAFVRHSLIVFGETVEGRVRNWLNHFPTNDRVPGDGRELLGLWDYIEMALQAVRDLLHVSSIGQEIAPTGPTAATFSQLRRLLSDTRRLVALDAELIAKAIGDHCLFAAHLLARELARDVGQHRTAHNTQLIRWLTDFMGWLKRQVGPRLGDGEAHRLLCMADFAVASIVGILSEGIGTSPRALDALDRYDFREFLRRYGAEEATVNSSLILGFYDLLFAYRGGDPADQRLAAGVSLRFIFRMCLTYDGAIFWKMTSGMGEAIIAPIYQVLERRGVRFEFFHRVRNLGLSADKRSIATVTLGRQATVSRGAYQPLVDVDGLPCWPAEPLYEQLDEGAELEAAAVNLESFWTPWKRRESEVVLEHGLDFDLVVFGISLASVPFICSELVSAARDWQATVERVETVRTQAVQLWLKPDLAGLGSPIESAVADAYPEPLDTWADMSHLIGQERWPAGQAPGNIVYFCAPMVGGIPDLDDEDAPRREYQRVKDAAREWLDTYAGDLWPAATRADNPRGLDWELLVDPRGQAGEKRLDSHFFRVNLDPSERYVLSLPDSTQYRLRSKDSTIENLYLAGDWVYTGVNAGCVEGTVMSGMLAANAMTDRPRLDEIVGYDDP